MYINEKLFSMTLRVIHSFKLNNCYMREIFFMNNYHYVKTMSWLLCDTIYVHVISYWSMKKVAVKSLSLQVRQSRQGLHCTGTHGVL